MGPAHRRHPQPREEQAVRRDGLASDGADMYMPSPDWAEAEVRPQLPRQRWPVLWEGAASAPAQVNGSEKLIMANLLISNKNFKSATR